MDVLYLFHRYRDDVYRLAVNYTHNPQEAEDVCQTVFLKAMEQQALTPGKEKAWLMQVTANECRSLLRSYWWRNTVPLDETLISPGSRVDETVQALGKLKPEYRVVLYLHYYEQYTSPEIAHLLKIPTSTVTTRLDRGRKKLRKLLEEG
ncbi:MAG: RNA polymerase sigma factor [Faecousia sp.]